MSSLVAQLVKNLTDNSGNTREAALIPELGTFPGEGNGNTLQYSCQDNLMGRGDWCTIVHGVTRVGHD